MWKEKWNTQPYICLILFIYSLTRSFTSPFSWVFSLPLSLFLASFYDPFGSAGSTAPSFGIHWSYLVRQRVIISSIIARWRRYRRRDLHYFYKTVLLYLNMRIPARLSTRLPSRLIPSGLRRSGDYSEGKGLIPLNWISFYASRPRGETRSSNSLSLWPRSRLFHLLDECKPWFITVESSSGLPFTLTTFPDTFAVQCFHPISQMTPRWHPKD